MRLILKVLGFVLSKAVLVGAMMLVLFVGGLVISDLKGALENRDRLEGIPRERSDVRRELAEAQREKVDSLTGSVRSTVRTAGRRVDAQKLKVSDLERIRDRACGLRGKVVDALTPGSSCNTATRAVRAAKKVQLTFESSLRDARSELKILTDPRLSDRQKLAKLGKAVDGPWDDQLKALKDEEETRTKEEHSLAGQAVKRWDQSHEELLTRWSRAWLSLLGIVLLILLAPPIWRTVGYWVVMPVVSRARKPIQLTDAAEYPSATVHTSLAERTLPIRLSPGEVLSARSEYVRPVQGNTARSQVLYDWAAPFISYAAGLHSLSRITGDDIGTEAALATPDDPSSYLMRIDFKDHPGLVMHPRFVVGVIGAPELKTRWHWGIQSFATWQVRYIMFSGSGSLVVQGSGDVQATSPGDRSTKIEQDLMMGFDSRLTGRVSRTEVFWPYLWGKTPLVDDEFSGPYLFFWQKAGNKESSNPAVKAFNAIFSALGKLLGF